MPPTDIETATPRPHSHGTDALRPREGSVPERRHDVRCLALPGDHGCVRDHGRRGSGDQGAGHRSVRQAVPRGRVHGARLRLPPPRGERRQPRQIVRIGEQHADWQAAIHFARTLPEVDPARVAIWGFSLSGGHIFRVAARNPGLAAAIAQTPLADGPAAAPSAMRHTTTARAPAPDRPRPARRRRWPVRPPAPAGPARRSARHRRHAHHARCPQRRPSAQP